MNEDNVDDDVSSSEDPRQGDRDLSMDGDDHNQDLGSDAADDGAQNVDGDEKDDDDLGEGDDDEVLAAVVVDDDEAEGEDEDEDMPTTEVVAEAPEVDTKPAAKKSAASPSSSKRSKSKASATQAKTENQSSTKRTKLFQLPAVTQERRISAQEARCFLDDAVEFLPASVSDSFVVRSFGQLYLEPATQEPLFSSANLLFPVGFSCDRYEFSPVHGRVIKLRCNIMDGGRIREKQIANGRHPTVSEGPVFRVMWGRGVDEDSREHQYPFNVFRDSPEMIWAKGQDAILRRQPDAEWEPFEGARIKVNVDNNTFYTGTICEVEPHFEADGVRYRVLIEKDESGDDAAIWIPNTKATLLSPGKWTRNFFSLAWRSYMLTNMRM
jgi:hypothetical protein